jgi:hypothetical protein
MQKSNLIAKKLRAKTPNDSTKTPKNPRKILDLASHILTPKKPALRIPTISIKIKDQRRKTSNRKNPFISQKITLFLFCLNLAPFSSAKQT